MIVYFDKSRPVLDLYAHQKQMVDKYSDKTEVALFLEMGCGKSLTTLHIAYEKYKQGQIKGLLLIAPNDVHKQWYTELCNGIDKDRDGVMWQELPCDLEARCYGGRGGDKELYPFETNNMFRFVSINVDSFSTEHKWEPFVQLANSDNYMVAIDEATSIKNPDSQRSKRLLYSFNDIVKRGKIIVSSTKKSTSLNRAVLTGTPVTNGPVDLWSIMEFLKPNYFGLNYFTFKQTYAMYTQMQIQAGSVSRMIQVPLSEVSWNMIHSASCYPVAASMTGCSEDTYLTIKNQSRFEGAYKHIDKLKAQLAPAATFLKLTDVVDMPKQAYLIRQVSMTDNQKKAYKSMQKDLLIMGDDWLSEASNKMVAMIRLQQISSGFTMAQSQVVDFESLDPPESEVRWLDETNPKLDRLMADIEEVDKPLLILTRYSAEAAKIYELCKKAGYRTGLFTGWKVEGGVDAFKAGELDILVANSQKISRGFNLQIAHTTLFYSNSFSMEVRQQAEFRTFRMGQEHSCLYIDYTASKIDELVLSALQSKKNLLDVIRSRNIMEVLK